jgi:hypothetical protein
MSSYLTMMKWATQMLGMKPNQYRNTCIAMLRRCWQQILGTTQYSELWYALRLEPPGPRHHATASNTHEACMARDCHGQHPLVLHGSHCLTMLVGSDFQMGRK